MTNTVTSTVTETIEQIPIQKFFSGDTIWVVQIAIIFLLTFIVSFALQRILKRLSHIKENAQSTTRAAIFNAAMAPLQLFVWIGGLGIMLDIANAQYKLPVVETILSFRPTLNILIFSLFLLRLNANISNVLVSKEHAPNMSTIDLIRKVATITILVLTLLLILPTFGISISGLLAFGGVGGIVVGFAAKDMLSNFFGALMVHLDRPFQVGDWIALPEKGIEGDVERIGWRQMVIRTFDKRQLFIPNAMLTSMVLVNPSRMTHRRMEEIIGVRYEDTEKLPAILNDVKAYLEAHEGIDNDAGVIVNLVKFSAYSVDFMVRAFSRTTGWGPFLDIKQDILFEISRIIARHGASIAFPTQVLHVEKGEDVEQISSSY